MKHLIKILLIISLCIPQAIFAAIDFDVTPIKYELEADPGDSITLPATLTNKGTDGFPIIMGKSDFEPTGNTGSPKFVRYSELVHPDQQLSTWVTTDISDFTIAGKSSQVVNFTIDIPIDATPGGHYGAIFFKNNAGEASSSGTVGISVDYGILILVTVSGEIVSSGSVDPNAIFIGGGTGGYDRCGPAGDLSGDSYDGICEPGEDPNEDVSLGIDNCPLGDLTSSNFDGKCIDNPFMDEEEGEEEKNEQKQEDDDFNVVFDIPFDNTGNTHIKPEGKIIVKDENGNIIGEIGEKLIKNDRGAVVGKEIVDYLPLNDEEGNVLPSSRRNFQYEWRGFPYRDIDGDIAYRTPGDYYTLKNQNEAGFLMFWERVSERKQSKTLTADIDFSYTNDQGEKIEFNAAREFKIQYVEQYIGLNPYVILPLIFLFIFGVLWWWFILAFKRKRCINKDCEKKIKRTAKVCPYCETIQNKKKAKNMKKTKKKTKKK